MGSEIEPENGINGVQVTVENSRSARTFKRISGLKGQKRIDALVKLLYSPGADLLTGTQYKNLALPDIDVICALYSAASSNSDFEWTSEPLETQWRCFHIGTSYPGLDRDQFASGDIADRLEDSLSAERFAELQNGAPFSDEEWEQFRQTQDPVEYENGSAVVALQTKDILGRGIYFVAEFGDWGTYLGSIGPYTDDQDLAESYVDSDDNIFEGVDETWQAETPNWQDESDDDEELDDDE